MALYFRGRARAALHASLARIDLAQGRAGMRSAEMTHKEQGDAGLPQVKVAILWTVATFS